MKNINRLEKWTGTITEDLIFVSLLSQKERIGIIDVFKEVMGETSPNLATKENKHEPTDSRS